MNPVPRLALTLGEPAGIGPDICLQLAQQALPAEMVVIGCPELLTQRARLLGLSIELAEFHPQDPPQANGQGRLTIFPIALKAPCTPGELNVRNSAYVLATLQQATHFCLQRYCQALVTAPVHKAIIHLSGVPFSGHTEYLAHLAGVKDVLMTFYTPSLITALTTTHCALKDINKLLTPARLSTAISLLYQGLTTLFNIPHPKIAVLGLNPHAGESGLLGTEEQIFMQKIIKQFQEQDLKIHGPIPADTAFNPEQRDQVDAILAMYHDQGLAPMKALFFKQIVNVTLGLPFLRTSVDHGTALSLAGSLQADPASLQRAIQLAADCATHQPFSVPVGASHG